MYKHAPATTKIQNKLPCHIKNNIIRKKRYMLVLCSQFPKTISAE